MKSNHLPQRRVLVTGGSGFIGTHLMINLLELGSEVVNVDTATPIIKSHSPFWRNIDILDHTALQTLFRDFRPEIVLHLAARTDLDEKKSLHGYAANIEGVKNILEACSNTPSVARAVITSSMLVCRLGYRPASEIDYAADTLYGQSKVLTEKITRTKDLPFPWMLVRPATIWGPLHERLRTGVFAVIRKGLYLHPGSKPCLKSYGYVENTIFQILKLAEAAEEKIHRKTFYLSDPPIDLRSWVNEFSLKLSGNPLRSIPLPLYRIGALLGDGLERIGINSPMTTFRLNNMITENVVDIEPTLSVTGPLPYSPSEGVDRTVSWLVGKWITGQGYQ